MKEDMLQTSTSVTLRTSNVQTPYSVQSVWKL